MSRIVLRDVDKFYGSNHVLKNINLVVEDGDFMTLLGPSGCGKTTTIRVLAGLERPEEGNIFIDDKEIVNARERFYEDPSKRGLNIVYQSYALWPHMTVFENVAFALRVAKLPKAEISKKVDRALERMQIAELSGRYPNELSGGQQQRVAIARAIVTESKLLLLDEPLSNLDAKLRIDMRAELKRLHHDLGATVIYVTHDQAEALTLSTKIAVFFEGVLEQVDSSLEVYQNPKTLQVAEFIGNPKINLMPARATRKEDELLTSSLIGDMVFKEEYFTDRMPEGGDFECVLGIRPEQIKVFTQASEGRIKARVYSAMPAGSETLIQLKVKEEILLAKELGLRDYHSDQELWLEINPSSINVFRSDSGELVKRV